MVTQKNEEKEAIKFLKKEAQFTKETGRSTATFTGLFYQTGCKKCKTLKSHSITREEILKWAQRIKDDQKTDKMFSEWLKKPQIKCFRNG